MDLVCVFVIGLVTGLVMAEAINRVLSVGTIQIVESIEDNPYLFLELSDDVSQLVKKEYVTVKVVVKRVTTQK